VLLAGIIIYIAGCLLFAYLAGRFGEQDLASTALLWPLILPMVLMVWLSELGERHGNAASKVGGVVPGQKGGGGGAGTATRHLNSRHSHHDGTDL
jgi:hypothetical protein